MLVQRYARLAGGSLTAVFILSQHDAAHPSAAGRARTIPRPIAGCAPSVEGEAVATVGISHLTTSRRLGAQAIRVVEAGPGRYRLDGTMPWVTGATAGGPRRDRRRRSTTAGRCSIALPTDRPGVTVRPPFPLAALQASCTSEIRLRRRRGGRIPTSWRDRATDVLSHSGAVGTGGLETSALALGQARAALAALVELSPDRAELAEPLEALCDGWQSAWGQLMAQARGEADAAAPSQIRAQANSLVLRATQAYLTARKGTGFLRTEPAQRWARQALFFLVWSCPAPIAQAAIRDLAGLCPAS